MIVEKYTAKLHRKYKRKFSNLTYLFLTISLTKTNVLVLFGRQEIIQRAEDRKADQTAHAQLVQSNYKESLARHEYAAQHPAYADGRVWWETGHDGALALKRRLGKYCSSVEDYLKIGNHIIRLWPSLISDIHLLVIWRRRDCIVNEDGHIASTVFCTCFIFNWQLKCKVIWIFQSER